MLALFYSPCYILQQCPGYQCLHILVSTCYFLLLIAFLTGVKRCHCDIGLHSPNDESCWTSFMCLLSTHIVLGEVSVRFLIIFFNGNFYWHLSFSTLPPRPSFIYLFIIWLSWVFTAVCEPSLTAVSRAVLTGVCRILTALALVMSTWASIVVLRHVASSWTRWNPCPLNWQVDS